MKKVIVISVFLVLTSFSIALAHGWWKGTSEKLRGDYWEGEGTGLYPIVWLSLKHKDRLALNKNQILDLEKILDNFKEAAKAQHERVQTLREDVKTALQQNDFPTVEQKITEMGKIHTDLLLKRLKAFVEAKTNILTSEQYNKLTEIVKNKPCSLDS